MVSMGVTVQGDLEGVEIVNGTVNRVHFTVSKSVRSLDPKRGSWRPCRGEGEVVEFSVPVTVVPSTGGKQITFSSEEGEFTLSLG